MERTHDSSRGQRPADAPSAWGELVLLSDRAPAPARKLLTAPLALVGRAPSCDIRLNLDGIAPFHCVLANSPDGIVARDLESPSGTYVNDEQVTTRQLRDGDRLTIGGVELQIRLLFTHGSAQAELHRERLQVQAHRQRLLELQRQLRRRSLTERKRIDATATEVAQREQRLEQEKSAFTAARLAWNGEAELGRRQLAEAREQLRQAQSAWQTQARAQWTAVREQQYRLEQWQTALEDDQTHWERQRRRLQEETEGLERRVLHLRYKLGALAPGQTPPTIAVPALLVPASVAGPVLAIPVGESERTWRERLEALEKLACDLADQRLLLVEHWQRLAAAQHGWIEEYQAITAELGTWAVRLPELEQALALREQAVVATEADIRRRHEALRRHEQQFAAQQARFRVALADWGSRHRQIVLDVQAREELANRHLAQLVDLRQRWAKRRRQELDVLRVERARCAKLRKECTALRQDLCDRLEDRGSKIEDREAGAIDPRSSILDLQSSSVQAIVEQRQALQIELATVQERYQDLQKQTELVSVREVNLDERQCAWEHARLEADVEAAKIRRQLHHLEAQCTCYEKQLTAAQGEVERLAHLLLGEPLPLAA